jgi:hypothetical protein
LSDAAREGQINVYILIQRSDGNLEIAAADFEYEMNIYVRILSQNLGFKIKTTVEKRSVKNSARRFPTFNAAETPS